jgi:hypothetical protein
MVVHWIDYVENLFLEEEEGADSWCTGPSGLNGQIQISNGRADVTPK